MERVAVLGAGVAGLAAGRELARRGFEVTLFDKGRRPAGRISTRRTQGSSFDHGAQYFTVRDARFREVVDAAAQAGAVAPWEGSVVSFARGAAAARPVAADEPRWVGVPGMSALATYLARGLDVRSGIRIERVGRDGAGYGLDDAEGRSYSGFDQLVFALPAAQAADLLPADVAFREQVLAARMAPCLAAMVGLEERYSVDFDGAFIEGSPLAWAARDSSKPGRPDRESWILHAVPDWSEAHFDEPPPEVARALTAELERVTGRELPPIASLEGFRWRYARPISPGFAEGILDDPEGRVIACGDWCVGPRVEDAWKSGWSAGRAVGSTRPPA